LGFEDASISESGTVGLGCERREKRADAWRWITEGAGLCERKKRVTG
jgi:hypothetical protein